jgi:very-short-patch-repair endonuclease
MKKYTTEEFIEKAKKIHDEKYDYSLVDYVNNVSRIKIVCAEHGVFEQIPKHHLRNHGCPKCAGNYITLNEFIDKANLIHNNRYGYSLVEYVNAHNKINIICPEHGIFNQTPNGHLNGKGCSICKLSKGELLIKKYLDMHMIEYVKEKRFADCGKNKLSFDFYLPTVNILIEYDGEQHFKPIEYWGGSAKLNIRQSNDEAKNLYANSKNILLLRIKYSEINNINRILKNII